MFWGDLSLVSANTVERGRRRPARLGYDPTKHRWIYLVDVAKCIGCGSCVRACERENEVPRHFFRTWVERYQISRTGEVWIDSPDGARDGFEPTVTGADITKAFFVPKLCNHCTNTPCVQLCPVGASFTSPDGVVLVDEKRCIGCSYCVQACPYGSRFIHPVTHTAPQVHPLLPPPQQGPDHRLRAELPHRRAPPGRRQGPGRRGGRRHRHDRGARAQARDAHRAQLLLHRPRRGGALMEPQTMNYLFPNDFHVMWSLMIVLYPYITGLVAGAFIVSSLFHVFGRAELKPVSRLAMVASLSFLLVATMPLLAHLGHPERAMNIMITPHLTSAMSAFGMIYGLYLLLVLAEIWLMYRVEIIGTAARSTGLKRRIFSVLALGVYDVSAEAKEVDHRVVTVLAAVGIPMACILHGYVGFMFGSVKANALWSTPLMPIIFLFSAVTSGIAMILVLYEVLSKVGGKKIDGACVQSLAQWLWLFATVTVTLEILEVVSLAYERNEEWLVVQRLIFDKIPFSYFGVQMIFGSLIPFILLAIVVLMRKYLTDTLRHVIAFVAAAILLIQVFAMRWNVVIGGQIFSKSGVGFRESYVPELGTREGVAMALVILVLPFFIMALINHYLPLSPAGGDTSGEGGA